MMQITKTIEWDMGHRIPNHKSKCKNLHGHRYKAEITLRGEIISKKGGSDEGMVLDFGDIKKLLIDEIVDKCDHSFMAYEKDKLIVDFHHNNKDLKFTIVPFIPTAERITEWLAMRLQEGLKKQYLEKIQLQSIKLWETPSSAVIYEVKNQ